MGGIMYPMELVEVHSSWLTPQLEKQLWNLESCHYESLVYAIFFA